MKHSVPALVSFWIALAGILLPLTVVAVVLTTADGNGAEGLFQFVRIARFAWLVFAVQLLALTLGIVALSSEGRKMLAWIGVVVSAVPVTGFLALIVSARSDQEGRLEQFAQNWIGSADTTVVPRDYIAFVTRWTGEGFVFHREDTHADSVGELAVPVDQAIKLSLEGDETVEMHIPAFRVRRAILAGRYQSVWFEATQTGRYEIYVMRELPDGELEPAGFIRVVER